jgi:hypothetical protein
MFLLPLMILSQASFGQIIVRSSLSCLGSTVSDKGFILRQTIGQASNTNVLNNEGLGLRQGFQQPIASYNSLKAVLPIWYCLNFRKRFPNAQYL